MTIFSITPSSQQVGPSGSSAGPVLISADDRRRWNGGTRNQNPAGFTLRMPVVCCLIRKKMRISPFLLLTLTVAGCASTQYYPPPSADTMANPVPVVSAPAATGGDLRSVLEGCTIVAEDGQKLGVITSNAYDTDSIFNEYGIYGGKYSSTSIWNDYGEYAVGSIRRCPHSIRIQARRRGSSHRAVSLSAFSR